MSVRSLPLVVIVGPTASGKTALAIELAEQYNGEIICADSRTIYKGMDIGTAKPSAEERAQIPHWGLDLVEPGDRFTAADFKSYAEAKIREIRARGKVPFLVGGTGLYVDAVIFDFEFAGQADLSRRQELESWTVEELQSHCEKFNIKLPENSQNKRHLIRAIERENISAKRRQKPIGDTVIVGISTDRNMLRARIESRAEQLFKDAVVEEATRLGKKYGWSSEAMTGNIYRLVKLHLEGELSSKELMVKFSTADWRLAKRQMTWFKRNPYIKWGNPTEVKAYIVRTLANEH